MFKTLKNYLGILFALILIFGIVHVVFAIPAMQQRCEPNKECIIGEYIFEDDGYTPITEDDFCQITITNPNDVVIVNNQNMSDKDDGWYYYSTSTLSSPEGLYRSIICCDTGANRKCLDKTFILGTSFETLPEKIWEYTGTALDTAGNAISKIWSYTGTALDTANNAIAKVWSYASRGLTTRQIGGDEYIAGESSSNMPTQYNIELVRQATFDFAGIADGGSTTTLVDEELNQPDGHWVNYELQIMSGNNIGLKRAICGFDRTSHTITLCGDPLSVPISAGDKYVISHERKLVHAIWNWTDRQLTFVGNIAEAVWGWVTRGLTTRQIGTNEYIAGVTTSTPVGQVASLEELEKQWTVYFSDIGEVLAGKTYRAKLWVLNYQSVLTDAHTTPTVTIYDANRSKVVENVAMTKIATGIYEYTYSVPSSALAGIWETVVNVEVESGKTIQRNDYWEVEASPAQVKINSITDNTVPSITANVTITNEGVVGYEYQYEYCIVDNIDNQCGEGDDVAYAMGAKYIQAGESWTTNLTLNITNPGTYWYKVYVYWGAERSVAILQFNAVEEATPPPPGGGGGEGRTLTPPILPPSPVAEVCQGADFNKDGIVNSGDFSILLYFWRKKPPFKNPCVDINGDGKVDTIDFSILLSQWKKSVILYKIK